MTRDDTNDYYILKNISSVIKICKL